MEKWKPIPNWENYQVSSIGRVRRGGRILAQCPDGNKPPYLVVTLCKNGIKKNFRVNVLVLLAFVGPPPKNSECGHLDGKKENNSLKNLKWITRQENNNHKKLHGTIKRGENHSMSKLTEKQVKEIRSRYFTEKITQTELGLEYGVDQSNISLIITEKNWN